MIVGADVVQPRFDEHRGAAQAARKRGGNEETYFYFAIHEIH